MINGMIGVKLGMTQVFSAEGGVIPVTVLKAGPCVVIQKKDKQSDGYEAVQVGYVEPTAERKLSKALLGHLKKSKADPTRRIKEFKVLGDAAVNVGDKITADQVFKVDENVDVIGTSKGKGFQGVMKRHHFRGGAATHGSMFHRAPGSVGASAFPSRTFKGMRGAGHMGAARVTVKNLQIVRLDAENNLLVVRGAVPGADGGYLIIRRSPAPRKIKQVQAAPPPKKGAKTAVKAKPAGKK
ncbi:MAG TPA: 50S ribosomal protein L3 [Candidatus Polarisedimenticolia bacterium]|nr:50S ribosomal protein L3 [Candidatus Polarisedimenticolia bacterium]